MPEKSRVTKVSRIIVRDLPALSIHVAFDASAAPVAFQPVFEDYQSMAGRGRRILLVKGPTDFETTLVIFTLFLYKDFDVVATFAHERRAGEPVFEVKQSRRPDTFPFLSYIKEEDVRSLRPREQP